MSDGRRPGFSEPYAFRFRVVNEALNIVDNIYGARLIWRRL